MKNLKLNFPWHLSAFAFLSSINHASIQLLSFCDSCWVFDNYANFRVQKEKRRRNCPRLSRRQDFFSEKFLKISIKYKTKFQKLLKHEFYSKFSFIIPRLNDFPQNQCHFIHVKLFIRRTKSIYSSKKLTIYDRFDIFRLNLAHIKAHNCRKPKIDFICDESRKENDDKEKKIGKKRIRVHYTVKHKKP